MSMYKLLDEIKNCFEAGSALWGGGVFVSVIAVSIYYLSTFVSRLNSKSLIEIDRLSANGKYIRNLYTEIDSVKESLRYFIYGTRWTKKLIYEFNNRGFKFKVQHPVLGYWRLLKKLHRVS